MRYLVPLADVDSLAKLEGWSRFDYQENIGMVSYSKNNVRVNVYLSKMTVSTAMNHPKKGKTQLFRRNVSMEQLWKLFKNPRVHTGKGYYKAS